VLGLAIGVCCRDDAIAVGVRGFPLSGFRNKDVGIK